MSSAAVSCVWVAQNDWVALPQGECGWYQRLQGVLPDHIPDVLQGEYYQQIEPVKERLFRELFEDGQVHRLAELGIGTGPNQGFYARQQASLLPEGGELSAA